MLRRSPRSLAALIALLLSFAVSTSTAQDEDARTHYNRGVVHAQKQEWAKAQQEFQSAIELDPELAVAHYNLGLVYEKLERYPDAEASLRTATEKDPAYAPAFMNLGGVLQRQAKAAEAAEAYRQAAVLRPDDVEAHFGLAWMLLQSDQWDAAEAEYPELSRLDKARADALYGQYRAAKGRAKDGKAAGNSDSERK